jgi:radical SAM protein with 4Fe4S-binding SPASM domain
MSRKSSLLRLPHSLSQPGKKPRHSASKPLFGLIILFFLFLIFAQVGELFTRYLPNLINPEKICILTNRGDGLTISKKMYPMVKHQVMIKHTHLGDFLLSGTSVLKVDGPVKEIVEQCDGTHTIEEIVTLAAEREGELPKAVHGEVISFLQILEEEGIILYRDSPDHISPIYTYDRPLSVVWEITYGCNHNCTYCISRAGTPQPDELSREEIDTILDELIQLQVGFINITGGEPLLRKDIALHIAQRASQKGIGLELLTNGMLITPGVAKEIYDAGIRDVQVSVDSAVPEIHDRQRGVKGAWVKAVESIRNLKEVGVHVVADAVVTSETLPYFEETRQFLREIGDAVIMGRVVPMGRGVNNSCLLTPEMHYKFLEVRCLVEGNHLSELIVCRDKCSIGTAPVFAPNGDVYPCMFTKYSELKLGNLREKSIQSIYKESDILHELISLNVDKINTCKSCWNRYYCGGGCRGCAYAFHGSLYENDLYICAARRKMAKEILKRGTPSTVKALRELIELGK